MSQLLDRMKMAGDLNKAIFIFLALVAAYLITGNDRVGHWAEIFVGVVAMGLTTEWKANRERQPGPMAPGNEISLP